MLPGLVWFPQMKMLPGGTMPADEKMSVDERRKYVKLMAKRYLGANRDERGELLTEMEAVTAMHRKSLTRLMNGESLERLPRRVQRGNVYWAEGPVAFVGAHLDKVRRGPVHALNFSRRRRYYYCGIVGSVDSSPPTPHHQQGLRRD